MKIWTPWNQIQKFIFPIPPIKKIPLIIFSKFKGVWKLPIWPYSGLIYARFENFIHNPELSPTKLFQIVLRLANRSFNFVRLKFSQLIIDIVQYFFKIFSSPKNYSIWIKGQSKHTGLFPVYEQTCSFFRPFSQNNISWEMERIPEKSRGALTVILTSYFCRAKMSFSKLLV